MTSYPRKHAAGLFPNREITEQALKELKETGFPMDRISVLIQDSDRQPQTSLGDPKEKTFSRSDNAAKSAVEGAMTGGLLTLAGGVAALLIPGIGLALAAESVLAVLLASATVATTGGLLGALRGWSMSEKQAQFYYGRITQGNYLVAIEGTEAEIHQAEQVLKQWNIQDWSVFAPPG